MLVSIGLMSGTSMDGIDAALIRTDGQHKIEEIGNISLSYSRSFHQLLKAAEYAVRMQEGDMKAAHSVDFHQAFHNHLTQVINVNDEEAARIIQQAAVYLHSSPDRLVTLDGVINHSTRLHAQAVKYLLEHTGCQAHQIDVVGYHGQTFFHCPPKGITVQSGNGQDLANEVGIAVVNDFRKRDVAHGGQGAPFAPLYHQALGIRDKCYPLAVVNCGGIANISLIGGEKYADLLGYDTGPGNGLVDLFVKQRTNFAENMDLDGKYGARGKAQGSVMDSLYQHAIMRDGTNYFDLMPPKSLDINDLTLVPDLDRLDLNDGCATLEAFTADSIVRSLDLISPSPLKHWILAGGGWCNPVIRRELGSRVKERFGAGAKINLAEEIGWNNKAMEAQIFAYLAVRSLQGQPISVPETTKVPEPLSGGHAYIPDTGATAKVQDLLAKNPAVLSGYLK